jgi:hypothetical protein
VTHETEQTKETDFAALRERIVAGASDSAKYQAAKFEQEARRAMNEWDAAHNGLHARQPGYVATIVPPPINPDPQDVANEVKYGFAVLTKRIADMQYRLADLAGRGLMDPEQSMDLQRHLIEMWQDLYRHTLVAVRDSSTSDIEWDEADNTRSDGVQIVVLTSVDPEADGNWEYNEFLLGDGAVAECPRGYEYVINSRWAEVPESQP